MTKPHNINFVVRQSRLVNSLLTAFFGLIFFGVLITYSVDDHGTISTYVEPLCISLAIFLISLANSMTRREILRINNKGIFYYKRLITSWSNFHFASWTDISSSSSIDDKIILIVQYYNNEGVLMEERLPMANSQDKSLDHIITEISRESDEQCNKAAVSALMPLPTSTT